MSIFALDVDGLNKKYFSSGNRLAFYKEFRNLMPPEDVLFPKYIKKGLSVLDLGCGVGRTTSRIYEMSRKVIGTDISEAMITLAKERHHNIDFRVMDASHLDFPDSAFDVVVFSYNGLCCLYPENKRLKTIQEIGRVLKKNGVFIFSSANRFPPWAPYSMVNLILTKLIMGFSTNYKIHLTRHGVFVIYETTSEEEIDLLQGMNFELLEMVPLSEKVSFWGYKPNTLTYYAFKKI
jgi:ubiquinone/menaquinone biosynthesis C-methylase UbiE